MVYYEMDAPQVHTAGQQVTGQTSIAAGLARHFETVLSGAETSVAHRTMVLAVRRFSTRWKPSADQVASRVESLGIGTSGSAVTISQTDLDAENCLRYGYPVHLYRNVNEPPVCPSV
ncbi:MAG: hypothetical protein ACRDT2_12750 [Natronosporangium sp.]